MRLETVAGNIALARTIEMMQSYWHHSATQVKDASVLLNAFLASCLDRSSVTNVRRFLNLPLSRSL